MMIPEPWLAHESMAPGAPGVYDYHSSLMEPWDGPASDRVHRRYLIGAVLDRNRPPTSRYYVHQGRLVIRASEVGVLDIAPENVLLKERLHPGRIFSSTRRRDGSRRRRDQGGAGAERPYGRGSSSTRSAWTTWRRPRFGIRPAEVLTRQIAFGYTHEDARCC